MKVIECPLARNARRFPLRVALIDGSRRLHYAQLNNCIEIACSRINDAGIRERDRVAILTDRSLEALITLYALWRNKSIGVLINAHQPPPIIREQCKQIGVKRILLDKGFDRLKFHGIRTHRLTSIVNLDAPRTTPAKKTIRLCADQPSVILYTSGTSGKPKASLLSLANLLANAVGANAHIKLRTGDRWMLTLPLYHVGGLGIFFRTLNAGAALAVCPSSRHIAQRLRRNHATHISLVATQLIKLMRQKRTVAYLKKMKGILLGGSSLPRAMLTQAVALKLPLYASYGLTEMASQVAVTEIITTKNYRQLSAKVLKGRQVKISSTKEILVKGPMLFCGYMINKKIVPSRDKNGWFHTKDLGIKKGRDLRILGRADHLIISGGENIQPEEIEAALDDALVARCCVVSREDKLFGQRPVAFVEALKNISKNDLVNSLQGKLAKFKIPDEWYQWPQQLRTPQLKVSRLQLQQIYDKKSGLRPIK